MSTRHRTFTTVLLATGAILGWFALPTRAVEDGQRDSPRAGRDREREEPGGQPRERGRQRGDRSPQAERFAPEYLPIRPGPGRRWRLGVYIDNTSRGVLITRVVPGSAAAGSGLEARDVIVTVGGYQVGQVESVLYDLGDELQLRASSRGDVRLLVWNHRNGRLVNVDVRLSPADYRVRERSRSPRGLGDSDLESDDEVR